MTAPSRRLVQPGPAGPVRIESVETAGRRLDLRLPTGISLQDAVAGALLAAGVESAVLTLRSGTLAPLVYVIPAPSPDAGHAAFYSLPFAPPGEARLEAANLTFGRRDGAPWLHCHGVWTEADGRRRAGHVIASETVIASPPQATAWGLAGAGFVAEPDTETNFALFRPVARAGSAESSAARFLAARIRPNEDLAAAVEALCRRHGFGGAVVRGGVGSLIGAVFADGAVEDLATEVLVLSGEVRPDAAGRLRALIEVALADTAGAVHRGRLVRDANPVCITFELVLEERRGRPEEREPAANAAR